MVRFVSEYCLQVCLRFCWRGKEISLGNIAYFVLCKSYHENLSELLKILGTVRCFLDETDYASGDRRYAEMENGSVCRM